MKESISKKNWGQFFTPIKVVRAINEMAEGELKDGMTICDPACGVGKFPLEFIKDNLDKLFKVENNKIIQKVKIVGFDKGFDKDEQKTIILAKANMLIYFCELIKDNIGLTREFAKIFNESFILKTNSILGTLSEAEEEKYDLILTNPPYVTSGSSNLKKEISTSLTLKNHYKINAMGIEGLFMEWIIKALKKGGKAFIVVPDGIFNRQNDKNLRQYILDSCYIDSIISLPLKTFFTTQKKTYILAITKKFDISDIQTDPVFTYLVSEIGESRDVNRFDIEQDDLKEAVNLYNVFKGNKKYFATLNHDKRCKIVSIDEFDSDKNWSVERWWSKEEKIELGIEKIDQVVSISEFSDIISDLVMSCNEFTTSLQDIGFNVTQEKKST
ncbi:class I SAM-dependent DNA methyltransferase [Candidatus Tisiphia endosymbiont of Empis tessellata]|uniref:HsdM family class I SAM-dependent methyltransferase n=1 Tax=Candidatus Tisiphia endosymbiont of Empis tessellata TaxID=3066259 RepID=UPI00313E1E15